MPPQATVENSRPPITRMRLPGVRSDLCEELEAWMRQEGHKCACRLVGHHLHAFLDLAAAVTVLPAMFGGVLVVARVRSRGWET
jgi:hypothetical protein